MFLLKFLKTWKSALMDEILTSWKEEFVKLKHLISMFYPWIQHSLLKELFDGRYIKLNFPAAGHLLRPVTNKEILKMDDLFGNDSPDICQWHCHAVKGIVVTHVLQQIER